MLLPTPVSTKDINMDEKRECIYGPPPIRDFRDKPQPTVYGPPPVRRGCARWLMVLIILAVVCAIVIFLIK